MRSIVSIAALFAFAGLSAMAKPLYDSVKSYVFVLNQKNFDS